MQVTAQQHVTHRSGRGDHFLTENITAYMHDIDAYKRITVERENELYILIHSEDKEQSEKAREELICSNLKLVVKIAHDFKHYGMTFADIVAEGNCGLMIAADRFDPSKGAKFSCYAAWWIKQSIRKALYNQTRTIRIPGGTAQKIAKIQRIEEAYVTEHGVPPTDEELSELTGFSKESIENLKNSDVHTYSMDDKVKDEGDTTFGEMIPEETDEASVKKEADNKNLALIKQLLSEFSERDRWILSAHYGLDSLVLPVEVISQETGLQYSDVRARIANMLSRLRVLMDVDRRS